MDLDCLPCIVNQICRVVEHLHLKRGESEVILRQALLKAAATGFSGITAPEFSQKLYHLVTRRTGIADPYRQLKKEQNRSLMRRIRFFQKRIAAARDPLRAAAVFALLGNIIDYGGRQVLSKQEVFQEPGLVPVGVDQYRRFRVQLRRARRLLYIADNAGEAVLDKLFLEEIRRFHPGLQIFYAVRSRPAINDVLAEDARDVGIDGVARIVPSGSVIAGTLVPKTSPRFRRLFAEADVVIAKGQGNFETLESEAKDVFFLFKIKCRAVARFVRLPLGTLVFSTRTGIHGAAEMKERAWD